MAQTERILTADARQEEIDRRFFAIATDLVGAPTELVDESGDIAWRTRSTLWGTTAWARDSSTYTPLRFPGQYYDPETGLHYNYFRHYDPETGRYTSPDPLGLAPGPNPVAYVDNPHSGCGPLGLMPKYTKEERAQKRINKVVDDIVERAQDGGFNCPPTGAIRRAGSPEPGTAPAARAAPGSTARVWAPIPSTTTALRGAGSNPSGEARHARSDPCGQESQPGDRRR
ncbi:RHS repeat-associated protein [Streptomyces luteogriseus]|uniref:RHS repeat-associated protein n=1 Tax=Streptomyces luteogriseus TaxID=68233 RepID=A0A7W7DL62_9ACTN|nr:RHS repeat-associated protein [Streptomyces luteogriseus]